MFDISEERGRIERDVIGFRPNTYSVKPVHIANGMFRMLLDGTFDTDILFRFVWTKPQKNGMPLRGHEPKVVYDSLAALDLLDPHDISQEQLNRLRHMLYKVVAADGAVSTTGMESYSAGADRFVANDRIAQDGGEFLGAWLRDRAPTLADEIMKALQREDDVISELAKPLLSSRELNHNVTGPTASPTLTQALDPLVPSATRLAEHVKAYPNKLTRLRFAVLYGCFVLLRYLADLERTLSPELDALRPVILLDMIDEPKHPIRLASQRTYILASQALTRAYIAMFTSYIRNNAESVGALADQIPTYGPMPKPGTKNYDKAIRAESLRRSIWARATEAARTAPDPYEAYGQAVYDILADDAEAVPYKYFRSLGHRCGLLQPAASSQPTKHFAPRQDMLEVLLRGVVANDDPPLALGTLLDRLWNEYGIIIGGRPKDEDILYRAGVTQADATALEKNGEAFAHHLQGLSFARLLADGVLEVTVGG